MKAIAILSLLFASALAFESVIKEDWEAYKAKHGKKYVSKDEDQRRMSLFLNATVRVFENHLKYYNGSSSFKLEVNEFADMTQNEFRKHKLGFVGRPASVKAEAEFVFNETLQAALPSTVDWRTKGAVSRVQNQGSCGSCWAFASLAALEGQQFIKKGKLPDLSEQQLVDCAGAYDPYLGGCNGGYMEGAYLYIKANKGVASEASYPYRALGSNCRFKSSGVAATVTGYVGVQQNENAMMQAVATVGPIAVSIGVNQYAGQYSQGVFPTSMCERVNNHGVVIVGYGATSSGQKYWIVKNSWGTSWGMGGYFYLPRGINACGVTQTPSYPLV